MRLCAARISARQGMGPPLNTNATSRLPGGKNSTAEKLLVAASELMIERAAIEVSLSDIAQKSGVNAALVKYHFGNKDGLLLALLARDAATEMSQLEYLISQPISPTAKLRLHIGGIIRAYHQFPYMNRLIHYLLQLCFQHSDHMITALIAQCGHAVHKRPAHKGKIGATGHYPRYIRT